VADVAGLWQRLSPVEREAACALARRWRVETMLGLGLRLAEMHLGLSLTGGAEAQAHSPRVQELASCVRLEDFAHDSPRVPMMERRGFENRARDSLAQRLRGMGKWLFQPTLADIDLFPLPMALYPLYAVLRPLRLFSHPWRGDWHRLNPRS
jgi:hypothetical protein